MKQQQTTFSLTLPAHFATIEREEMTYVEGGYLQHIQLKQTRSFLNRSSCQYQAQWVRGRYHWNNITQQKLAEEIFAHAEVYYAIDILRNKGVDNAFLNGFYNSAKVIDLENGLDPRHSYFSVIWMLG